MFRRRPRFNWPPFPRTRGNRQCCKGTPQSKQHGLDKFCRVVFLMSAFLLIAALVLFCVVLMLIWSFWETVSQTNFLCMVLVLVCTPSILRKVVLGPVPNSKLPKSPFLCIILCYVYPSVMSPILTWVFSHTGLLMLAVESIIVRTTPIGQQLLTIVPIAILRRIDQNVRNDDGNNDDNKRGPLSNFRDVQLKVWASAKYKRATQNEITILAVTVFCLTFQISGILPVHFLFRLVAAGFAYAWTFHTTDEAMYRLDRNVTIDVNLLWSQSMIEVEIDLPEDDGDDAKVNVRKLVAEQLGVSIEAIVLCVSLLNVKRCRRCHECIHSSVCGCRGYFDLQYPNRAPIDYPFHRSQKDAGWVMEAEARVCVDIAITMLNGDSHMQSYTAPCVFSFTELYKETLEDLQIADEDVECVEACDIPILDGVDLRRRENTAMDTLLCNNPTAVTYQGGPYHVQLTLLLRPTTVLTVEIKRTDNTIEEMHLPVCLSHSLNHAVAVLLKDIECVGEMSLMIKQPDSTCKMVWDGRKYVGSIKSKLDGCGSLSDNGVTEDSILCLKPYRASIFSWMKRAS